MEGDRLVEQIFKWKTPSNGEKKGRKDNEQADLKFIGGKKGQEEMDGNRWEGHKHYKINFVAAS